MWITNSSLSCKFATIFQLIQFSFFQVKKVNHCEGYVNVQDNEHQLHENMLHHFHFHHYSFL